MRESVKRDKVGLRVDDPLATETCLMSHGETRVAKRQSKSSESSDRKGMHGLCSWASAYVVSVESREPLGAARIGGVIAGHECLEIILGMPVEERAFREYKVTVAPLVARDCFQAFLRYVLAQYAMEFADIRLHKVPQVQHLQLLGRRAAVSRKVWVRLHER